MNLSKLLNIFVVLEWLVFAATNIVTKQQSSECMQTTRIFNPGTIHYTYDQPQSLSTLYRFWILLKMTLTFD